VTEVFSYLARNPHHSNVFERMYRLNEDNQNLAKFVNDVEENLSILIEFMLDTQRDPLERHLRDLFGEAGVETFEKVFTRDGPLSMTNRIEKTFSRITALSGSAETNKAFTDSNSRLDQWLSRLGYLANYRSFGQQFPVKLTGYTEDIEFEVSGRLYDMYPGEENDLGGLITLHGSDYIVNDVRGTATPLATVALCTNEECAKPFESYALEVSHCPHCESELEETNVHGISSVECKTARGGQKMYRTYGLMTTSIRTDDSTPPVETRDTKLFGLPCEVTYGELEVTDFVYAFERGHSASPDTETLRSEALIERDGSRDTSGLSWQERLDDADAEEYAPVGQQYHTQGLTLIFGGEALEKRFDRLDQEVATWPQALTSLEQALSKAIAVTAPCDLSDFRVKATKTTGEVTVQVVDSRQGGNGITWQVLQGLADVESQTRSVADCDRCRDYCDECLLLSRTPAYYLENDLLDHTTLEALVGEAQTTPSVSD
jgi:hypothetical protein